MKKDKKLISILISSFNKEKFIKKTLRSVFNQSYKNYEVIVFDDNSTDDSIRINKKFPKVKIIRNKKKKQVPHQLIK